MNRGIPGFLALALLAVQQPSHANLLTNGSFESGGAISGQCDTLASGSTGITGWVVSAGNVDYCNTSLWNASNGSKSVDLSGSNARGTLSQTFASIVGQSYTVTFDLSGNPGRNSLSTAADLTKIVTVSAGGTSQNFTYQVPNFITTGYPWHLDYKPQSWSFFAIAASTTLSFASATSNSDDFGPVIDNVTLTAVPVSAVPLPAAAWLLLSGLGGLGFLGRRKAA